MKYRTEYDPQCDCCEGKGIGRIPACPLETCGCGRNDGWCNSMKVCDCPCGTRVVDWRETFRDLFDRYIYNPIFGEHPGKHDFPF